MRIRLAIPDHLVTPEALEAALEATSLANAAAIERGEVPLLTEALRRGVKWREEPFIDGEHFDLAHKVQERRWGDCDDLAPWLTGELRATGADTGARTRIIQTGPKRFHAVTETSDGEILDPSKWAGMGRKSRASRQGVSGVLARPFAHVGGGALAVVPDGKRFRARCDVPWPDGSGHIASHARARTADDALNRAIAGAVVCGEQIESPLIERACCAGEFLLGDLRPIVGALNGAGPMVVGAFEDRDLPELQKNYQLGVAAYPKFASTYPTFESYRDFAFKHRAMEHEWGSGDFSFKKGVQQNAQKEWQSNPRVQQVFGSWDAFWLWYSRQPVKTKTHAVNWGAIKHLPEALQQAAKIATPFVSAVNPALGLGMGSISSALPGGGNPMAALNALVPGAGGAISPLNVLAHGFGSGTPEAPEGGQVIRSSNGAVSVPLEGPDSKNDHHMFLYYHPLGNPGPVVMRF